MVSLPFSRSPSTPARAFGYRVFAKDTYNAALLLTASPLNKIYFNITIAVFRPTRSGVEDCCHRDANRYVVRNTRSHRRAERQVKVASSGLRVFPCAVKAASPLTARRSDILHHNRCTSLRASAGGCPAGASVADASLQPAPLGPHRYPMFHCPRRLNPILS
jgi:hypothetical protein